MPGTNTQGDHLILLGEFFAVCKENNTRLKLEKCEFMHETMQYLGFDIGYGWWTPAASKAKTLMDAKVRHEDPKKGLHDVRSFVGASQFLPPPHQEFHLHQRHPDRPGQEEYLLPAARALKSNKRLTNSRTKWLTLSAWACPVHKGKLSW